MGVRWAAEGDRRSSEGRVGLGMIKRRWRQKKMRIKEDGDKRRCKKS